MLQGKRLLAAGLAASFLLHAAAIGFLVTADKLPKKRYAPSRLVMIQQPKPPEKAPEPPVRKEPPKPVQKKVVKQEKIEEVKPVFGVTKDSLAPAADTGIGVRVGNTLMKEQEKEYTPPEKVKAFAGEQIEERKEAKPAPLPAFQLSALPVYKSKVNPKYPEELKSEELEGEVILEVTISEKGEVLEVKVKASDHDLFTRSAVAAMKQTRFTPALKNGMPVPARIDIPIKFMLDI